MNDDRGRHRDDCAAVLFPGRDCNCEEGRMSQGKRDWTCDESGRSNSSERYNATVNEVARLIVSGGPGMCLDRDWAHGTAGLIVAQLAHKHGFRPPDE